MPTLSDVRRRQASAHRPGDTVCGISRASGATRCERGDVGGHRALLT